MRFDPISLLVALHLICAVLWIGGMGFALLVLRPSLAVLAPAERGLLHNQVFRRFFLLIWHAMPLLILSGVALMVLRFGPGAPAPWPVNAMAAIGIVMAILFAVIFFGPWKRFRQTTDRARASAMIERIRVLVTVNFVLGLIALILGGMLG
ncbi:MAG: CopD family protein [Rhodospirillales bacterium]|nr:CopD family protein [Rhodospirillales bacterium]